jgi:hypothetical protein
MDPSTTQDILRLSNENKFWMQTFLAPATGGDVLVTSSVLASLEADMQLDKEKYQGIGAFDKVKADLGKACLGCSLAWDSSATNTAKKSIRYLRCSCYRLQKQHDPSKFKDGCLSATGAKVETVKQQKKSSKGTAIERMAGKQAAKKLEEKKSVASRTPSASGSSSFGKDTASSVKVARTVTARAASSETRCKMKLTVYYSKVDGYFYLGKKSCLQHNDHAHLPGKAVTKGGSDMNDEQNRLLQLLYDCNGSNGLIRNVMNTLSGGSGEYLPQTICNYTQKCRKAKELSQGITENMSDAEKVMQMCDE